MITNLGEKLSASSRIVLFLCLLPVLFFSLHVHAQDDVSGQPEQLLPVMPVSDTALQERLNNLFKRVQSFENVNATVQDGVVVLTGKVETAGARERVEELAARFEGVLYVENRTEQRLELETRVTPAVEKVQQFWNRGIEYLPLIVISLLVVLLFWLISFVLTRWEPLYRWVGGVSLLGNLVRQILRTVIVLMGLILALEILDLTALMGALVGTAGLFGLAVGFAFRDIVENYLARALLSIRSPFDLNDFVNIAGEDGVILRLTTREVVLMSLDGNHVRIPNSMVFKSVIRNFTRNPRRGFLFPVGVGMGEDLLHVQAVGLRTLRAMKGVLDDPGPSMQVSQIGDFSIVVKFQGWVDQRTADFIKVRSEAIRLVKTAFDQAGIEMPEPSQTVNLTKRKETQVVKSERVMSVEEEAGTADVDVVRQLDQQIREDFETSQEENLLKRSPAGKTR
ncbi:MAG: BON domain-containing protein [Desulfovibrionales bacterium]